MAGGKDQPKQLISDVVVQGRIKIGHGLLLGLHLPGNHLVLTLEHSITAQMIQGPPLGSGHQPCAWFFWNACRGPVLEGGQQSVLRQLLCKRYIAQHCRQASDQPRLFDPPGGQGIKSLWSCMNSFADARASSLSRSSKIA